MVSLEQFAPAAVAELGGALGRADEIGEENRCEHAVGVRRFAYAGQELTDLRRRKIRQLPEHHMVGTRQLDVASIRDGRNASAAAGDADWTLTFAYHASGRGSSPRLGRRIFSDCGGRLQRSASPAIDSSNSSRVLSPQGQSSVFASFTSAPARTGRRPSPLARRPSAPRGFRPGRGRRGPCHACRTGSRVRRSPDARRSRYEGSSQ